jgi:hypothetical protein
MIEVSSVSAISLGRCCCASRRAYQLGRARMLAAAVLWGPHPGGAVVSSVKEVKYASVVWDWVWNGTEDGYLYEVAFCRLLFESF